MANEKKEKKQKISVSTLPNGYALKVDGQEYMYFNQMDLLAGFMVHVGLQEADYMENGSILTMLFQTMIGREWEENVSALKAQIRETEEKVASTLQHLEQTAKTGNRLEPRINEISEAISSLSDSMTKQKEVNKKTLFDVRESTQLANETSRAMKTERKAAQEQLAEIKKNQVSIRKTKQLVEEHLETVLMLEQRLRNLIQEAGGDADADEGEAKRKIKKNPN